MEMSSMINKKYVVIVLALGLLLSISLAVSQDAEQIKQESIANYQESEEAAEQLEQEIMTNYQESQEATEQFKQDIITNEQASQEAQTDNLTVSSLEGVSWSLDSLLNSEGETVSVLPNTDVTAWFQDGRVSGNAGCNNYAAGYESIGNNLTIGPMSSTLMACPDENVSQQESDYLMDLGSAASYDISDNQLRIMNSSGAVILTYSVAQTIPLVGTLWNMTTYNNGMGALVSALSDINTTALFGSNGSLTGSAGCNRYQATYQTNDSQIKIGPTATTRMMCEESVMEQEIDYLNALQSAVRYETQADDLVLFNANDTKAVTFQRAK